jgi:hypothetical protein
VFDSGPKKGEGEERSQSVRFPESLDEWITDDNPVRVVEAFVEDLDLAAPGLNGTSLQRLATPRARQAVEGRILSFAARRESSFELMT